MASPIAHPARVCPTASHSAADAAWLPSALTVAVIDGNSSARITPAALSPCHSPSAAAPAASRDPYRMR
jgi:hypothetical protein